MTTFIMILSSAVVLAIAYFIVAGVKLAFKLGFKGTIAVITLPVRAPKKFIAILKRKSAERKFIKENKAYWTIGQEFDKIDAMERYKKDERVFTSPEVRAFELKRKDKANKRAIKANKKASKSKASKTFDKITK